MSSTTERFSGFAATGLTFTPIPSAFFSHVLPHIDDLAELRVTLHLFYLLHRKKGDGRHVTWEEIASDRALLNGLSQLALAAPDAVAEGLAKAVVRGTVLHLALEAPGRLDNLYFLNNGEGRRAIARLRSGDLKIDPSPRRRRVIGLLPGSKSPAAVLYEQKVGVLTPGVAEELKMAEREFGLDAVLAAIGEAVRYEKRHWAYVRRVLDSRGRLAGGMERHGKEDR